MSRRTRQVDVTITVPGAGSGAGIKGTDWSTPESLLGLGDTGKLVRSVLRAPAASTITKVDLLVFRGKHVSDIASDNLDPATVPDEDRVLYRTGIVVAGSATAADDDYNIGAATGGALWDASGNVKYLPDDPNVEGLWLTVKGTAGNTQANVTVAMVAEDVA